LKFSGREAVLEMDWLTKTSEPDSLQPRLPL
jgi:hypothetical protein